MKKYFSFMAFAMMTAFCCTFASCDSDDDEGGNGGSGKSGDYTISVNGETFYYGYYGVSASDNKFNYIASGDMVGSWTWYNNNSDSLLHYLDFSAYDESLRTAVFDEEKNEWKWKGCNKNIKMYFYLHFDPRTAKQGEILPFDQRIDESSKSPSGVVDIRNHIEYREGGEYTNSLWYYFMGDPIGSVKFISYKRTYRSEGWGYYDILTLEFQNLTMIRLGGPHSDFQDAPEQITLNGEIMFTDTPTGAFNGFY